MFDRFMEWLPITAFLLRKGNRMLRLGLGQNSGEWFFRVDLWFFAVRVSRS